MEDFKMEFDIQRFADEEAAEDAAAEQDAGRQGEEPAEEPEEIPAELGGLPEDIAREAMAEAAEAAEAEANAEGQDAQPSQGALDTQPPPETIPYPRFKQEVDKGISKDDEIARLKAEIESMRRQQAAPPPQMPAQGQQQATPPPQAQPQQRQNPALTKENAQLIGQAIRQQAMQMAGMTAEDLDSLEYMDDGDPRKQQWAYAQEMAKNHVFGQIQQAWTAQQTRAAQFLAAHQKSVADYNAFAKEQMAEPDFPSIKEFARVDYFNSRPQQERDLLAEAYARLERNVASPMEIYAIKKYYEEAKAAYRSKNPVVAPKAKGGDRAAKMEQAKTFPRAGQVQGAGDIGNGVTIASLEKMLDELPIDKIDPKYIKMLQG